MSKSLALHTTDPDLLRCQVARLARQAGLGANPSPAAVGLAYVEADKVLLRKRPGDGSAVDPVAMLADVASEALLFHVRGGAPGRFVDEDEMPLRFRSWMFTQHGSLEFSAGARATLIAALPDFFRRQSKGKSPGELFFLTFLRRLREGSRLDDFDLAATVVGQALGEAVREAEQAEQQAGSGRPPMMGFFVSNGRVMAGTRQQSGPLSYALLEGISRCELCGIDESTTDSNPLRPAHRRVRGVALCTGAENGSGFIEVPEGSVITVERSLGVQVSPLP